MNDDLRSTILRILCAIAPEADPATIAPDVNLRDQLDLDSMDFLNFVIAVDQELGVGILERDYGRLTTLDAFVAYVDERRRAPAGGPAASGEAARR
jgi:acyl carrier protein